MVWGSPITPKASKEESAAEMSGICSLDTEDMDASVYFICIGLKGRWPLVERGWMIRPSTAAQMRTLRARPGIMRLLRIVAVDIGDQAK